jgi:hypothetical protein
MDTMAIDPATGLNIPSPSDDLPRPGRLDRPLNDDLVDIRERTSSPVLLVAIAIALLIGVGYYFFAPNDEPTPNIRADVGAVTQPEPSPN